MDIVKVCVRSTILFAVGALFTLMLKLLQVQRSVPVALFPQELITALYNAWWILPVCGSASAVVGMLFPCLDNKLGEPHTFNREWSSVMRCIAVFIGIGQATAKVDFENNFQLSVALAVMSLALWWLFDRSVSGFGIAVGISIIATIIVQLLLYHEVFNYTERDFLYVRSWLPYVFFSGGITVGNIGRQLAICDSQGSKQHCD